MRPSKSLVFIQPATIRHPTVKSLIVGGFQHDKPKRAAVACQAWHCSKQTPFPSKNAQPRRLRTSACCSSNEAAWQRKASRFRRCRLSQVAENPSALTAPSWTSTAAWSTCSSMCCDLQKSVERSPTRWRAMTSACGCCCALPLAGTTTSKVRWRQPGRMNPSGNSPLATACE